MSNDNIPPALQQAPFLYLADHPDQNYERITDAMRKGYDEMNKLDVDPSFIIKDSFLSARNIDIIQRWLIRDVLAKTGIEIPYQKMEHIMELANATYETYGQNLPFNLKDQIYELDLKVIQHLSPIVIAELYARTRYLRDIDSVGYVDLPQCMSARGQRTLPTTSRF